jgi:signal transduction histidine kinase/DNA-binding NarL/FixJ family response regulator
MLIPGTQMHIVTFIFICIELVIFFYLLIYKLARPHDSTTTLNIILISLLNIYNVTGGLLPDPNIPGSFFIQESIAYGTGFIVPCYFPFYVYKAFGLEKMQFQAYKGVFLCLVLPYIAFVIVFAETNSLDDAKNLLILPVLYAIWVICSLFKAIGFKYQNDLRSKEAKEEVTVLFLSLTPWIGLPMIAYFNLSQAIEASVTNTGFLLLLALQLKNHIKQMRIEHEKLMLSEKKLVNWNDSLKKEVERRTKELEKLNEQKTNTFVNLAHETKTPLTLINNYLDEYISKKGSSEELNVVKKNIDKLSNDIVNFFDLERFNKGFAIYNHNQVCNFCEILSDDLALFKKYVKNRNIVLLENIKDNLLVKADPVAINRIIINLVENAIKFSDDDCEIEISLQDYHDKINFSVKDSGIGIPPEMQSKVFEPYYQITNQKKSIQGMGLGLPIVKRVIQDLNGEIKIESNPKTEPGTKMIVTLNKHTLYENEIVNGNYSRYSATAFIEDVSIEEQQFDEKKETILIVEDNVSMVNYLAKKLQDAYNVYTALNGNDALKKLKTLKIIPDLIISDVMMDKVDGYAFAKIISNDPLYNHIPFMFLSAKAAKSDKLQGLRLGAIDYVQKPFSVNVLKQKIESILQNVKRQRSAVFNRALNVFNKPEPIATEQTTNKFEQNCELYHLTSREKDIAKLVCEGRRYKEIGEALFIAERTVTKHVQNIFEKVGVTNKIELVNKLEA